MKNIFGNIHFYDPYVVAGYEKVLGANRHESLEELLKCSDIVSVHTPLGTETKGLINDSFINSLKSGCILINSARGGILSSKACLYNGLKSGKIGAIGLDVLPEEPPLLDESDKFILNWLNSDSEFADRIIINPHTAYYSPESYKEMRIKAAKMALKALKGVQTQNRII
jgi:phosphoglycerate dehydrogenase-like enzyme